MVKNKTTFKELLDMMGALVPMCSFELPEGLCTKQELFFRRQHKWMDSDATNLFKEDFE